MTTTPLVTVIVPAYNAERYLADALRSVIDQEFRDFGDSGHVACRWR